MNLIQTLKKEWQIICHDAWLKALLFWVPVLLSLIIWGVFSAGIARDLPIGIVDHDNSSMSRSLIRNYDASPSLAVTIHFSVNEDATVALREGSIYALVIIPHDLEKNTLLGKAPQVTAFYNSQFILIGKLINSGLLSAHGTYVAQIETFKDLTNTHGNLDHAIGEALPISSQISPLFNASTHYGQFLVTAVIPAMWQIIIMVTVVLFWARPLREKSVNSWLSQLEFRQELVKLIPYIMVFWLQGIVYISIFYGTLQWPMHGSWLLLILAQFLLVIACISVTTLFFFVTLDATRAMSFVAGFSAPAFAFMGVTFPTTDMPFLAQLWRALLPVSHYINIQIHQVNYGTTFNASLSDFLSLILFISALFMANIALKKHKIKKIEAKEEIIAIEKGSN